MPSKNENFNSNEKYDFENLVETNFYHKNIYNTRLKVRNHY